MTRRLIGMAAVIVLALGLSSTPAFAQAEDLQVTGAGGAVYAPGAVYNGVTLSGLRFGIGVAIATGGTAEGQFQTTLLAVEVLGQQQKIVVEGKATSGSSASGSTATFSGTATVDMGTGAPPTSDVPFTVTIVTNSEGQGTLTLVLGGTTLPAGTVNEGTLSIR